MSKQKKGCWNEASKKVMASGETWLVSREYSRIFQQGVSQDLTQTEIAKLLQVPPELFDANDVTITIQSKKNISFGKYRDKRLEARQ